MCGGCNQSSVTNAPNPVASAAYSDVIGKAQGVAGTPYQPYTGELTAGLNGGQTRAIGQLEGAYGTGQPFFQAGATNLSNASGGLGGVQNYLQAGAQATAGTQGYQNAAADQYGQANNLLLMGSTANQGVQQYQDEANNAYGQMTNGLGQVGNYLNAANGYFGQAAGLATPQDFTGADGVSKYMNPYQQSVIDTTMATARQNDAIQNSSLLSNSIGNGAYGGDRNGIAVATLAGQQDMANNSTIANLNAQNYAQAAQQFNTTQAQRQAAAGIYGNLGQGELSAAGTQLQTAAGYGQAGAGYAGLGQLQGQVAAQFGNLGSLSNAVGAGYNTLGQTNLATAAQYGNLGTLQGTTGQAYGTLGSLYGNLGTQAQAGAVSGASAGLQGATLQQQTQQAQDTAAYQQFQNSIQYPFNTTGWLSNIVQGIGSASGGTSTTQGNALSSIAGAATSGLGVLGATGAFGANGYLTGAGGLLNSISDERAKDDKQPIGKTFDGQTIYSFRYKGDPKTNIGLMAQEVEKRNPEAVGSLGNLKTVNYGEATRAAAERGHFANGGGLGNIGRMLAAPDQIRLPGGLGAIRPHFDDGGATGVTSDYLASSPFAQALAKNPLASGQQGSSGGTTMPGGNLSRMPTASAQPPASTSGNGGLGALAGNPGAAGGMSAPSGGFSGKDGDTFGAGNQNLWLSLIAGGAGAMSGGSASGLANIGTGLRDGIQTYMGLKNADQKAALNQSEIASRNVNTNIALRDQDMKERQFNMLLDANQKAADILRGQSDPTQTASAAPASAAPVAAPAPSGGQGAGSAPPAASAPAPAAPSVAPVASGQPAVTPVQTSAGTLAVPTSFWNNVSPESNPAYLTAQAQKIRSVAQAYAVANPQMANSYMTQASQLDNRARQIYDSGIVSMRDGSVGMLPGFNEAKAQQAAAVSSAQETARLGVADQHELVPVQPTPGGPTYNVPKSAALASPGMVKEQPAYFAEKQKAMASNESEMNQAFQQRQISLQRINEMQSIQQKYQTGDLAGAKADAVALGRAMGIPVSDSVTASPENFQRFGKDAYANVISDMKTLGGKPLVAELDSLQKANANAEMSPAANAAILAQGKGIIAYQDQKYNDYLAWKKQNPYATDSGEFDTAWAKAHPLGSFVDSARKDTAYQGQVIPPDPAKRDKGQMYMTPKGPMRWMGNGWAAN